MTRRMREWADFSTEGDAGAATLSFKGPLLVSTVGMVERRLRVLDEPVTRVDLSAVPAIDTVGAWLAWRLSRDTGAEITGASDEAQRLIEAVSKSTDTTAIHPERPPLTERVPRGIGKLVVEDGQHQLALLLIQRAHGVVDQHPARLMQQQAGKGQALLLFER